MAVGRLKIYFWSPNGLFCILAVSVEVMFKRSLSFNICDLIFMQLLFSYLEYNFFVLSFFTVLTIWFTNQSLPTFWGFSKGPVLVEFFPFIFNLQLGKSPVFCFYGGWLAFIWISISVSFFVHFFLSSFSDLLNFLFFSDRLVLFIVFSNFCIVQLDSRSQSMPGDRFMPSFRKRGNFSIFLCPLFSASAGNLPNNFTSFFLTLCHLPFFVKFFWSVKIALSGGISGPETWYLQRFFVALIFFVVVNWFLWSLTCFFGYHAFCLAVPFVILFGFSGLRQFFFSFSLNLQTLAKCSFFWQLWHVDTERFDFKFDAL